MSDKHDYAFTRESYAAVEQSNHPLLRSVSMQWRHKIVSFVLAEWSPCRAAFPDQAEFATELRQRVRQKIRNKVGFPWVTLAMILAEIIIKILIAKWFSKQ